MTDHHRALGVAALFTAVLAASCSGGGSIETTPTETASSTPPSVKAPSSVPSQSASASGRPFELYTHCGVENTRIDGVWWHADPPLYNQRRDGPPTGWGDPYQTGRLTMVSDERAVFEALGQRVVFVPAPDNQPVRICD